VLSDRLLIGRRSATVGGFVVGIVDAPPITL
jgi:hypothetical protein